MTASQSPSSSHTQRSNDGMQITVKEEKPDDQFVSPCGPPIYGRRGKSEAAQRVPSINCKSLQKVPSISDLSEQEKYHVLGKKTVLDFTITQHKSPAYFISLISLLFNKSRLNSPHK